MPVVGRRRRAVAADDRRSFVALAELQPRGLVLHRIVLHAEAAEGEAGCLGAGAVLLDIRRQAPVAHAFGTENAQAGIAHTGPAPLRLEAVWQAPTGPARAASGDPPAH